MAARVAGVAWRALTLVVARIDGGQRVSYVGQASSLFALQLGSFLHLLHFDVSTLSRNDERMRAREWLEVVLDEDGR